MLILHRIATVLFKATNLNHLFFSVLMDCMFRISYTYFIGQKSHTWMQKISKREMVRLLSGEPSQFIWNYLSLIGGRKRNSLTCLPILEELFVLILLIHVAIHLRSLTVFGTWNRKFSHEFTAESYIYAEPLVKTEVRSLFIHGFWVTVHWWAWSLYFTCPWSLFPFSW